MDFDEDAELALEAYYELALNRHLPRVTNLQFLHHAGGLAEDRIDA